MHHKNSSLRVLPGIAAILSLTLTIAHAGPDEDLIAAVNKGELPKAERALEEKANPEARGEKDATALMLASELGHVDIAKLLLAAGASVTTTRESGIAALHHAASTGKLEVLKLLLASGANASIQTEFGLTPFMAAAQSGCLECLQLLRTPGEDINAQTKQGFSALDYAASSRSSAVFRYLFEQGATFDVAKSARDRVLLSLIATPTDTLLKRPALDIEFFRMLIARGASLESKNNKDQTPLILSAERGNAPVVQALIEAKANVKARDKEEATALIAAASRNVNENVKMILSIEKSTSMKDVFRPAERSDKSPATASRLAIARALVEAGAEVSAANKNGDTPLHKAAGLGDVELVELLIAAGADVNARSKTGHTALMSTATWNYQECAAALLKAGADAEIAAQDGRTALSIAKASKSNDVAKLLKAASKK